MPIIKKDKQIVPVNYTNRDFESIRNDLINHAKIYYPDTYKDFSAASFGSFMVDTVAYVGDMLSFYLDYQANESFFETAVEYENVVKHARQLGYRQEAAQSSRGMLTFYAKVPVGSDGGPDTTYMPILQRGSTFSANSGAVYTIVEDVDFSNPNNLVTVGAVNDNGSVAEYVVRAKGQAMSGQVAVSFIELGEFEKFKRVEIPSNNVITVLSMTDSKGHSYVEVDHLSQDIVFKAVPNPTSTQDFATSLLKAVSVPRRFVVEYEDQRAFLQFGYGSDDQLTTKSITHPSSILLKQQARDFVADATFDPSKILDSDTFGVAPSNTTLTVYYLRNTADIINAAVDTVGNTVSPLFKFKVSATSAALKSSVRESLEVSNEEPIIGEVLTNSPVELRRKSQDYFATQSRAVTKEDYISLAYRMPPQFGALKRCTVAHDNDSFKRNLNMYVLSEDANGFLTTANSTIKQNLKTWLQRYKMINDTIDILDGKVVNFGINFIAVADYGVSKFEVFNNVIANLTNFFFNPRDMGETLYVTDIYEVINDTIGVVDVVNLKIENKTGVRYSSTVFDIDEYISPDGRYIRVPSNYILEMKYPTQDIKGTIR